jgi:peptidase M28-like protein
MRRVRKSTLFLLLIGGSAAAQSAQPASNAKPTTSAITPADVVTRITYLASDELKGRDTPSPGLELAAAYIAQEFKSFGLQPGGDSSTFVQRWPFERRAMTAAGARVALGGKPLTYLQDFFVVQGQRDSVSGAILYAGLASAQPAALPAAARGKIVAYYIPGSKADESWLDAVKGVLPVALAAQPQAIMLFLDPSFPVDQIGYVAANAGNEVLPVMLLGVRYEAAKAWFRQAGRDLDAVRTRTSADASTTSGLTLTAMARAEAARVHPPNVVGILPGSDPALKDTYVVLSAHMDHVGVGAPNAKGDSIYNGADDDASGTSAVLEVAQAFAALPAAQRPKRSIIFLAVSGEEKGLLGSGYFVEHPPVPTEKIVANINIDMIGRNNPDTVVAIGQEYSSLGPLAQQVAKANPNLKLIVAPDLWPKEQLFFRSDHFNFAKKNIPAIFFTTGLHADYHQPSDEVQTINADKLSRIAMLTFELAKAIASAPQPPQWTEQGKAALRAISGNE